MKALLIPIFNFFFEEYDKEALELSLRKGQGHMSHLKLRVAFLNSLLHTMFPFLENTNLQVINSWVSHVDFKFSLMSFRSKPFEFHMGEIFVHIGEPIILEPNIDEQTSETVENESLPQPGKRHKKKPGTIGKAASWIVRKIGGPEMVQDVMTNLVLSISQLVVCLASRGTYATAEIGDWTPPCLVMNIHKVEAYRADNEWHRTPSSRRSRQGNHILKKMDLRSVEMKCLQATVFQDVLSSIPLGSELMTKIVEKSTSLVANVSLHIFVAIEKHPSLAFDCQVVLELQDDVTFTADSLADLLNVLRGIKAAMHRYSIENDDETDPELSSSSNIEAPPSHTDIRKRRFRKRKNKKQAREQEMLPQLSLTLNIRHLKLIFLFGDVNDDSLSSSSSFGLNIMNWLVQVIQVGDSVQLHCLFGSLQVFETSTNATLLHALQSISQDDFTTLKMNNLNFQSLKVDISQFVTFSQETLPSLAFQACPQKSSQMKQLDCLIAMCPLQVNMQDHLSSSFNNLLVQYASHLQHQSTTKPTSDSLLYHSKKSLRQALLMEKHYTIVNFQLCSVAVRLALDEKEQAIYDFFVSNLVLVINGHRETLPQSLKHCITVHARASRTDVKLDSMLWRSTTQLGCFEELSCRLWPQFNKHERSRSLAHFEATLLPCRHPPFVEESLV